MKYLGINLTKDVQDVYTENHPILPREIKEDLNKEEQIGRDNIALFHRVKWVSRQTAERNRKENVETDPHASGQLICNNGAKTTQWKKNNLNRQCWNC